MNDGLLIAAFLLVAIAIVHSVLGERYILIRLFRRDNLPRLFGSDWFTKRTLRFVWHVMSVAWLGFAGVLVVLAQPGATDSQLLARVVSVTFLVTASIAGVASRGKHLSWIVFLAIACLAWFAQ